MKNLHFLAVALLCAACATGGSNTIPGDRNLISNAEIDASNSINAYEMVRQLRPHWLSVRGTTDSPVVLYLDQVRIGSVDRLREYAPGQLHEVRYLGSVEATQRFGTDHRSGAIMASTMRGN